MKIKAKRIFNLYNLAILACIILIAVSLFIIFKPAKKTTSWGQEIVVSDVKQDEEITEDKARDLAVKQFKKLGEKDVKKDSMEVKQIKRSEELYYFISSANNTLEIKIKGGEITRINSASVK